MKKIIFIVIFLLFVGSLMAYAGHGVRTPYTGSKEYEHMRQLVGSWEGTSDMGKARVEYRLTAGGSAIVETLFPGTPEEMVSVYFDNKGKLSMTHYCMLQNQPSMKLLKAEPNKFEFVFAGGSNINPKKDAYMRSLTISFVDKDHIVHKWTSFADGKLKQVTKLDLSRVK